MKMVLYKNKLQFYKIFTNLNYEYYAHIKKCNLNTIEKILEKNIFKKHVYFRCLLISFPWIVSLVSGSNQVKPSAIRKSVHGINEIGKNVKHYFTVPDEKKFI